MFNIKTSDNFEFGGNKNNDILNFSQTPGNGLQKITPTPPDEKKNYFGRGNKANNTNIDNKKIKKNKIFWGNDCVLKKISLPEKLNPNEKIKRKYKVQITYNQNGKDHAKTIRFGDIRKSDYIEDKDENKKNKLLSKLGNTHNVLHPNFWRLHLLNHGADVKENWNNLISNLK